MKGRQSLSQPHFIGSEDQRRLLGYLRENASYRDYAIVLLCLRTGLSTSEAVSLNVRHVLRDSAGVSVLDISGQIAKGGIARELTLDAETRETLQGYLQWKADQQESMEPESPLFLTRRTKKRIGTRDFQRVLETASIEALGVRLTPHDLRYTFGRQLYQKTGDLETVRRSLGLTSLKAAQIYANAISDKEDSSPNMEKESDIKSAIHQLDGEYMREWLVLGPLFPDDLSRDFLADAGGEANVEPREDGTITTGDGKTLTWNRYEAKGNVVDLVDAVGHSKYATAYAFCVLQAESASDAEIYMGCSDCMAIWINEEQAYYNAAPTPFMLDAHIFEAPLRTGSNRCLIKIINRSGFWCFAMRAKHLSPNRAVLSGLVTDSSGHPIPHASVQLERNREPIAETQTDVSGKYHLNIYPANGLYDLSTTSGEMGNWQLGIRLCAGERSMLDLTLKRSVSIEGTLLMLDDTTPHTAVPVQAICNGKVIATVLSDESGKYRLVNLKPGDYYVRCQVVGGYAYYPATGDASHIASYGSQEKESDMVACAGAILRADLDKTLTNIDFRLAPFKKGIWENRNYLDGLVENTVNVIHEVPGCAMWLGTQSGISRYDGKDFVNFTTEDGLNHNKVIAIYRDLGGAMLFGTRRGVCRHDGAEFTNFIGDTPMHCNILTMHRNPDGVIWFGTEGDGVFQYDGSKFTNFVRKDGLALNTINAIFRDLDGAMWFGTEGGGVSRYDGNSFINFTTKDGLAHNIVNAIYCDPDGVVWFGTENGVSRYDGKSFASFTMKDGLAHNTVNAVYRDADGVMWLGTKAGVSRYDGTSFVNLTAKDGRAGNWVHTIHRDSNDVMWFGTVGGICRYDSKSFINFTARDGLAGNWVHAIYSDPDGVMWFATDSGIFRYDGVNFANLTTEDGLADNDVWAIHRCPDGVMWFGTRDGLSRYDGKEFVTFTRKNGLMHNWICTIYPGPDDTLWFGTWGGGVLRYDCEEFTSFTARKGLVHNWVRTIHCDPNGVVWFGTQGGVSRYDGKGFMNFTVEDGLAGSWVQTIHRDPNGVMWFGTDGGVSRYDGEGFTNLTTKDGLVHNSVCAIHRGLDGTMWFGTMGGGVSQFDGATWVSLDSRDGLSGNMVLSILQNSEGLLWFGTDNGVTLYRRSSVLPKAHIISVTTTQTYRDLSALPVFTSGTRVTVEYNAIDFKTQPEKRQYRCRIYETQDTRLKTQDEEPKTGDSLESWVLSPESNEPYNPPTKQTTFDWTPDKPGTYIFEVQAIDRDLNYSEPASLSLTVEPDPVLVSMQTELNHLRQEVSGKYHFENIIGDSFGIRQVRALMERAIDSGLTVLITGETGTGKELVAKAIHYSSPRKSHPLLDRNCAAIPKDLLASELFGHRKGAFTGAQEDKMGLFEAASGGTVLLDEISEMSEDAQVHLLRVLEEREVQRLGEHTSREVDVRIIAMTNRDLMKEVTEGRFREDLYYRLSEFPIPIPPLRERPEDIPLLAEHFLHDYIEEHEKELDGFAPDVFEMLQSYPWPGNVRELRNAVRRAAALAEEKIQTYHFPSDITQRESLVQEITSERIGLSASVERLQRRLVENALRECNGNRTQAARMLNMHRPGLIRLMKRLGID